MCVAVVVGWLSLSTSPVPMVRLPLFAHADKVVHGLMYMVLAAVFCYDLGKRPASHGPVRHLWAWLLPTLYGGALELLQQYCFPPRTGDWLDWAADAAGAIAGCYLLLYVRTWTTRH
ncbi:MAG: VanZ family protein [Paludibacteraceae bacterium]|nr:VanZ family protein [Paludibacteraceae bacterium]